MPNNFEFYLQLPIQNVSFRGEYKSPTPLFDEGQNIPW